MAGEEREVFEAVFSEGREGRSITPAEIADSGGPSTDEIAELVKTFGLQPPAPDEPWFTEVEADTLRRMQEVRDIWPLELSKQVGRVYGRLLNRIAQTEAQLFRLHVETRLRSDANERLEGLRRIGTALEKLLPISDPFIVGVHRRWLEHEMMQAAVMEVEEGGEDRPAFALPGRTNAAVLLCDLKDFTAFAVREGDHAAIQRIEDLADLVVRERGEDCRLTKSLGDGYMLVYSAPHRAVDVGKAIVEACEDSDPGVHASVHFGPAFVHEGDYFGSTVNLTARLLGAAERDQLVGSTVIAAKTSDRFQWAKCGERVLRGVGDPTEVFILTR